MTDNKGNIIDMSEAAETIKKDAVNNGAEGVYVHKFSKPLEYKEQSYDSLTFDFDGLSGNDILAVEAELSALGMAAVVQEFNGQFLIRIAARACTEKIGADVFAGLPIRDYNRIVKRARSFLLAAE